MKFVSCLLFYFLLQMYSSAKKIPTSQRIRRIPTHKTGRTWYVVSPASTRSLHNILPFTEKLRANLLVGTPIVGNVRQKFTVQFDTGLKDSWIFSKDYYPCDRNYPVVKSTHSLYDRDASSTYHSPDPDEKPVAKLFKTPQGWSFGFRVGDDFYMLGKKFNATFYEVVKAYDQIAKDRYDGVMGLQYDHGHGNWVTRLCAEKLKYSHHFSVYYRRIYDTELDSGVLTICAIEEQKFRPKTMQWIKEVPHEHGAWKIPIQNARLTDTRGNVTLRSNFTASLNTGLDVILAPRTDMDLLYLQLRPYYIGDPETSEFDCEKILLFPNIILTIDGKEHTMTGFDYTLETQYAGEKNCALILTRGASDNEWSLGAPFLRKYYTAFDMKTHSVGLAEPVRVKLPLET